MSVKANVVSITGDPSNQFAGIATVSGQDALGNPLPASYVAYPGYLDTLFSDTADLPAYQMIRRIYVGTSGNIVMWDWDGNEVLFNSVPVGVIDIRPRRIGLTNTTASKIIGLR